MQCPLLAVKQAWVGQPGVSAFDPKATLAVTNGNVLDADFCPIQALV
jgi:hypothetical protein